jgi:hypothetical protein
MPHLVPMCTNVASSIIVDTLTSARFLKACSIHQLARAPYHSANTEHSDRQQKIRWRDSDHRTAGEPRVAITTRVGIVSRHRRRLHPSRATANMCKQKQYYAVKALWAPDKETEHACLA